VAADEISRLGKDHRRGKAIHETVDCLKLRLWGKERDPDDVRKYRLELRRIGAAHNIHLPPIEGPPEAYRREHKALMMDFAATAGALRRIGAESPEKYPEVMETAREVLEQWERFKKK
jgi:hypothetical protein